MSQWTNGNHWEQINKLIKETIVCCVKFKRFLMWILHVWNLQWINVYSNQTKGFCFYQWNRKGKWFLPWMRLNVVYQVNTSNRWTLTVCRNNIFKIIYVLITNFFPKSEAHKNMLNMFHLLSYDLIQSEASKYKVSNVSSPSVVDSFSANSCSYELFAMNPSFIFLASASSSLPSSTSLSKA